MMESTPSIDLIGSNDEGFVKAQKDLLAEAEEELKAIVSGPTGACTVYTSGFKSCTDGITERACAITARKLNLGYQWSQGSTCQR
jgi:hypothetical protein